jgi:FtsZ-binding cell division protein ZapB
MNRAIDTGSYILEEAELEVSSDSDEEYLGVEPVATPSALSEDLGEPGIPPPEASPDQPSVIKYNEVVDDFTRNFLKRMNMQDTLATFQREWYSRERPTLFRDLSEEIEDVKLRIGQMEIEKKKWQTVCDEVQQTWDRLKQERNYHRDGLEALKREKSDLTSDLRKMKKTKKRLNPALDELKEKFEQVNKERSLLRMERDRLMGEIQRLQAKPDAPKD